MYFTIDELVKINEGDKRLIDANKISPTGKRIMPTPGDLARLDTGAVVMVIALDPLFDDDRLMVVWDDGSAAYFDNDWINVVEIIGKCVFGVYK